MEVRLLAATGIIGSGFPEDSVHRAPERDPQAIGCDSGSTDPGPCLGSNKPVFPRSSGDPADTDVYDGQQSAPILDMEVPL